MIGYYSQMKEKYTNGEENLIHCEHSFKLCYCYVILSMASRIPSHVHSLDPLCTSPNLQPAVHTIKYIKFS